MSNQTDDIKIPTDTSEYQKNYNESDFWTTIKKYAKKLGRDALSQILVAYYVMQDPNTPLADKAKIAGALGYLILPLDLIPDAMFPMLGPIVFADDIYIIKEVLRMIASHISVQHKEMANLKLKEWFGEDA
jgi:uncharacterized membrane protein YkvA (DUF1232 family)